MASRSRTLCSRTSRERSPRMQSMSISSVARVAAPTGHGQMSRSRGERMPPTARMSQRASHVESSLGPSRHSGRRQHVESATDSTTAFGLYILSHILKQIGSFVQHSTAYTRDPLRTPFDWAPITLSTCEASPILCASHTRGLAQEFVGCQPCAFQKMPSTIMNERGARRAQFLQYPQAAQEICVSG